MPTRSDHFIRATLFKGRNPDLVPGFTFLKQQEVSPLADPTPVHQKQIRLARNVIGRKDSKSWPMTAGNWHPDTPEFGKTLRTVMEALLEAIRISNQFGCIGDGGKRPGVGGDVHLCRCLPIASAKVSASLPSQFAIECSQCLYDRR
jgi:hypothetical protein